MALYKIRYKGLSDVREMSRKALKDAGVPGIGGDLVWDRSNNHTVHVDSMSERLEEILRSEGTFNIEEVDKKTGESVKVITDEGTALDDTGSVVVDGSTGQKSVKK